MKVVSLLMVLGLLGCEEPRRAGIDKKSICDSRFWKLYQDKNLNVCWATYNEGANNAFGINIDCKYIEACK